jgi:hypothetical protein
MLRPQNLLYFYKKIGENDGYRVKTNC